MKSASKEETISVRHLDDKYEFTDEQFKVLSNIPGVKVFPPTVPPIIGGDEINHPPHYKHSAIEPIDAIEAWKLGFNLGNCVKYISRAHHKTPTAQGILIDLQKARWYLDREIKNMEKSALTEASDGKA